MRLSNEDRLNHFWIPPCTKPNPGRKSNHRLICAKDTTRFFNGRVSPLMLKSLRSKFNFAFLITFRYPNDFPFKSFHSPMPYSWFCRRLRAVTEWGIMDRFKSPMKWHPLMLIQINWPCSLHLKLFGYFEQRPTTEQLSDSTHFLTNCNQSHLCDEAVCALCNIPSRDRNTS